MSKQCFSFMLIGLYGLCLSCTNGADQKKAAMDSNAARFAKKNTQVVAATLERDARFAVDAAASGMMEEQLGLVARGNAGEGVVKQLGSNMAKKYAVANMELKKIAVKKNISIPAAPDASAGAMALRGLKGSRFDDRYLRWIVDRHRHDITAFKKYISAGKDSDLLRWAIFRLPVLEQDLKQAQAVDSMVQRIRMTY